MTIARVGTPTHSWWGTNVTAAQRTVTIPGTCNFAIAFGQNNTTPFCNITFYLDGNPMTLAAEAPGSQRQAALSYLVSPPTGEVAFRMEMLTTAGVGTYGIAYLSGVDTDTPVNHVLYNNLSGSLVLNNLASTSFTMVFGAWNAYTDAVNISGGTYWTGNTTQYHGQSRYEDTPVGGTTTYTNNWTRHAIAMSINAGEEVSGVKPRAMMVFSKAQSFYNDLKLGLIPSWDLQRRYKEAYA